jgi:hypothetical protein
LNEKWGQSNIYDSQLARYSDTRGGGLSGGSDLELPQRRSDRRKQRGAAIERAMHVSGQPRRLRLEVVKTGNAFHALVARELALRNAKFKIGRPEPRLIA